MNCSDCRHSRAVVWENDPTLECHRHPPQVTAIDNEAVSGWPSVEEADWCGEWSPT